MKRKILFIFSLFIFSSQFNLWAAKFCSDSDNYINSIIYIHPEHSNNSPYQAKVKKIKIQELKNKDLHLLHKNINKYLMKSDKQNKPLSENIFEGKLDSSTMQLSNPIFIKGKTAIIKSMPVLDQGASNACVTFSTTAAMDILFANGKDKYSNYMSLCLGYTLSRSIIPLSSELSEVLRLLNLSSFHDPWEGSEAYLVINQFNNFGVVSTKDKNSQNGKFNTPSPKPTLSRKEINKFSKLPKLSYYLYFNPEFDTSIDIDSISEIDFVNTIKHEIDKGNIVSIGLVIAPEYPPSNTGMTGRTVITKNKTGTFSAKQQKNIANYNTWCCNKKLGKYIKNNMYSENVIGAHQMIIIGYMDSTNIKDAGVFIVRNSWGSGVGDKGNNYITYKYAYIMNNEILSISSAANNSGATRKFL